MTFTSDVITVDIDGHIATVWLDRPEARNACGPEFWSDLPRAMDVLAAEQEVRAIVLAAKGEAFTIGLDLKAFGPAVAMGGGLDGAQRGSPVADRLAFKKSVEAFQHTITSVARARVPVIAAVHGWCIGAGVDLITACDIRLAAEDAVFSVRETKIGMVADVGTLQRLPGVVAPGHVAELVYTGKDIDAHRAAEIGLVNTVYPDAGAVQRAAHELAEEIAANSPLAVQGSKAVLKASANLTVEQSLEFVALWNSAYFHSNDLMESMQAFIEKRPPNYTGT